MDTLNQRIKKLNPDVFSLDGITIRPVQDDWDLWYAVVECKLAPGQEDFVNPAGFSIGRAYLNPEHNIPCIIWKNEQRIGYIVMRDWSDGSATSWSYYLDQEHQGLGYGKTAAMLAIKILKAAEPERPVKLSAEASNEKAHRLYRSVGFRYEGELDGDDLVFIF